METFLPMPATSSRLKYCLGILVLTILLLPAGAFAEVRALWVMPWSLTSQAKIDTIIQNAVATGHTELLLEVRYRSDALYTTNRKSNRFTNPEPRSYVLANDGFDPLAYAIRQAHLQNLKVQAWVVVLNATTTDRERIKQNYIYQNHYNWISHDGSGKKMLNTDQFGYYIDPGVPEVHDYLIEVLSDIVDGYPELDGLHLDYIRYPNVSMGFHPVSVARFEEQKASNPELSWNEWRTHNVTSFVERLYHQVKQINPSIMLSAAVIANYREAVNLYGQAWEDWLRLGIIDRIYPMLYNIDNEVFERNLFRISQMPRHRDIIMGLRAWNANGNSLSKRNNGKRNTYTISDVKYKIDLVRNIGFGGLALFSYESLMLDSALYDLAALAYPPALSEQITRLQPTSAQELSLNPKPSVTIKASKPVETEEPITLSSPEPSIMKWEVLPMEGKFVINLDLPREGRWKWEIRNAENNILYQRYRYYLRGENTDYWSGILDNGDTVKPGAYTVHIFQDEQKSIIIPFVWHESGNTDVRPQ